MTLRLYADEGVDFRIASGLSRRGIDVTTALHDELIGAPRPLQLDHVSELKRVIVSSDTDVLELADAARSARQRFPGLIFILPRTPVGTAIRNIALLATALQPSDIESWIEWVPAQVHKRA